jgi:hypothetical protein
MRAFRRGDPPASAVGGVPIAPLARSGISPALGRASDPREARYGVRVSVRRPAALAACVSRLLSRSRCTLRVPFWRSHPPTEQRPERGCRTSVPRLRAKDRLQGTGRPGGEGCAPPCSEEEARRPVRCDCNTRVRHLGTLRVTQPCSQRCSMMARAVACVVGHGSARKSTTERSPAHSTRRPALLWRESWRMIAYRKPSALG